MSVSKIGTVLFSSFLTFATAPLASSQSTQDQTQEQTTKKTQEGTAGKETGKTVNQNAPADQNKAGTTEKSKTGKTGTKNANGATAGTNRGQTSQLGTTSAPAASSVSEVKQIQQSLADLGYNPGELNGIMTAQTQDAVRQFQWLSNLPVTGIVDEQTLVVIDNQAKGGVENARLGQAPLSAEREKPNMEFQQNRTDTYNQTQSQSDKTYKQDKTDSGKHHDEATVKHEKDVADRIANAAAVLQDLTSSKDNRIPNDLFERAEAIVVIPHMVKGAFGIGGRYGKGVVSERSENGRWSPPAFMDIGGGSFGFQIGASATDLVLVFTDRKALDTLEKGKDLKLGVDAGIVAGPVGRSAEAGTHAKLESAIYAYSRSKGLFAGVALDGAVLYMDNDMNRKVYGDSVDSKQILNGNVAANSAVRPFMDTLERVVPKKRISQK